tara:strand:- start:3360 stop:3566 length:207 start_codon:yes stop_codon:yes gene_type:complete
MIKFWFNRKTLTKEELFQANTIHYLQKLQHEVRELGIFTQKLSDKIDNLNKDKPAKRYTISDMDSRKS